MRNKTNSLYGNWDLVPHLKNVLKDSDKKGQN